MDKKEKKRFSKMKAAAAEGVIDVLMGYDELRVSDACEVLEACADAVKGRLDAIVQMELAKPLSEALEHLSKSKIHKPSVDEIEEVSRIH